MQFTTCSGCSRHVRIDAGVCPFCAASRTAARVLVGAAAISSLSGCPRPAAEYGGPPIPEEQWEPAEDPTATTDPAETDPAETDPAEPATDPADSPAT